MSLMPAELSDANVILLALGGIFALATADDLTPREYARLAADPEIKKRAERIIMRESARLADGEPVSERMRWLIGVWNRQGTRGKRRGRPDAWVKETAVCVARYDKLHKDPFRKRELSLRNWGTSSA
jgi:hypothetical protein